jgi:oligoendopeptidase F|tara:strand:+ start:175 stop:1896 length:1722 start_codon:yes stop_codon:yes gene_type:complete
MINKMKLERVERKFVDNNLEINSWEMILPYFEDLTKREISSRTELENWLKDKSELEAILEEDMAWRYIKMTIDTTNDEFAKDYAFFVNEISPKAAPYDDILNKKLINSAGREELEKDDAYRIYFRSVNKSIDLFREENIPLETKIQTKSSEYGTISGAQNIEWDGETITMQKAANFLKNQNPELRKLAFEKMTERRSKDIEPFEALFDELVKLRHQVAINAGYSDYRDYKFDALGRFDYTKEDCFDFHKSVKEHIVPLVREIQKEHADKMGSAKVKPWDTEVDPDGLEPLKPFENGKELLEKTKSIFNKMDSYFGDCLQTMDEMNHLDLDSKNGKSPGGYNYPLYEIGVPFIFMNASGAQRDVVTMIHEGGHAVHSFLSRNLDLTAFKNVPSEVAELASMSMELLSMEYWNEFYDDEVSLKRAKKEQLIGILKVLPWISTIDAFQHWIYTHPNHSRIERQAQWTFLQEEYGNPFVDWTGYEGSRNYAWHRQLHLFEVPFYYIEYGISQLGALGIWKNSLENKKQALEDYKKALSIGYTQDIPSIYKSANLAFDFSSKNIQDLAKFTKQQLDKL